MPATGNSDIPRLDDVDAVRLLTARYNQSIDAGLGAVFADLFTNDGVIEVRLPNSTKLIAGRAEIEALGTRPPNSQVHCTSDAIIEIDGDSATQSCTSIRLGPPQSEQEMPTIQVWRYQDELVRTASGWRFQHRTATPML